MHETLNKDISTTIPVDPQKEQFGTWYKQLTGGGVGGTVEGVNTVGANVEGITTLGIVVEGTTVEGVMVEGVIVEGVMVEGIIVVANKSTQPRDPNNVPLFTAIHTSVTVEPMNVFAP